MNNKSVFLVTVTALAVMVKLLSRGDISAGERVVIMVTGSGLKDVDSALKGVTAPPPLPCSLEAVRARLGA